MNPLERYLLWLAAGTVAALSLGWIAFQIQQQQIAPAVLFPLAAGGMLGGLLLLVNRAARLPNLPVLLGCAVAWGLLLVITQDYIGHRVRVAALDEQMAASHPLAVALAEDVRPAFGQHLAARVRNQPVWWTLDAILTCAGACAVLALGTRWRKTINEQGSPHP